MWWKQCVHGASELRLNASIFNFLNVRSARLFGFLTNTNPNDPDSYMVCPYLSDMKPVGLMSLFSSSRSLASKLWGIIAAIILVIVLSVTVILLLIMRYRHNKRQLQQPGEFPAEHGIAQ